MVVVFECRRHLQKMEEDTCEAPSQAEELLAVISFCTQELTGATVTCVTPAQDHANQ